MTTYNMKPYDGMLSTPMVIAGADQGYGGRLISLTATITMAAQASGSILKVFKANPGWLFMGGYLLTNTTLGSATLAIGNATTAALYRAAAVLTTIDVPQPFMNNVAIGAGQFLTSPLTPYTAAEEFLITTAAASLPASGILLVVGNFMIS